MPNKPLSRAPSSPAWVNEALRRCSAAYVLVVACDLYVHILRPSLWQRRLAHHTGYWRVLAARAEGKAMLLHRRKFLQLTGDAEASR
jgi:hypothetical protein